MPSCPCGNAAAYEDCCDPVIQGRRQAATAEALMRSRYCAYARQAIDYLQNSLHPKKRKGHDPESSREWSEGSEWLGLEVLRTEDGGPDDETGVVEFKAHYRSNDEEVDHHEIAEFRRQEGVWYFWEGKTIGPPPVTREAPKVGRNDPCPCGSGKKFKKCCGKS